NNAEDRRVRADAESQREDGEHGERRRATAMAVGEMNVLPPLADRGAPPGSPPMRRCPAIRVIPELGGIAKPSQRLGVRVGVAHALRAQFVGAEVDVERHLVVEVAENALACRRQPEQASDAAREAHQAGSITLATAAT